MLPGPALMPSLHLSAHESHTLGFPDEGPHSSELPEPVLDGPWVMCAQQWGRSLKRLPPRGVRAARCLVPGLPR